MNLLFYLFRRLIQITRQNLGVFLLFLTKSALT